MKNIAVEMKRWIEFVQQFDLNALFSFHHIVLNENFKIKNWWTWMLLFQINFKIKFTCLIVRRFLRTILHHLRNRKFRMHTHLMNWSVYTWFHTGRMRISILFFLSDIKVLEFRLISLKEIMFSPHRSLKLKHFECFLLRSLQRSVSRNRLLLRLVLSLWLLIRILKHSLKWGSLGVRGSSTCAHWRSLQRLRI